MQNDWVMPDNILSTNITNKYRKKYNIKTYFACTMINALFMVVLHVIPKIYEVFFFPIHIFNLFYYCYLQVMYAHELEYNNIYHITLPHITNIIRVHMVCMTFSASYLIMLVCNRAITPCTIYHICTPHTYVSHDPNFIFILAIFLVSVDSMIFIVYILQWPIIYQNLMNIFISHWLSTVYM